MIISFLFAKLIGILFPRRRMLLKKEVDYIKELDYFLVVIGSFLYLGLSTNLCH